MPEAVAAVGAMPGAKQPPSGLAWYLVPLGLLTSSTPGGSTEPRGADAQRPVPFPNLQAPRKRLERVRVLSVFVRLLGL
jgi:hypothetical protein